MLTEKNRLKKKLRSNRGCFCVYLSTEPLIYNPFHLEEIAAPCAAKEGTFVNPAINMGEGVIKIAIHPLEMI